MDNSHKIQFDRSKFEDALNQVKESNAVRLQRELENHQLLNEISENTKSINELVLLVRQGNQINQQTFELLQEIQTIIVAQTAEEANTILRRVVDKALQLNENVETAKSLIEHGKFLIEIIFGP